MTDIPVHVLASGWSALALSTDPELAMLPAHGGSVTAVAAQSVNVNRNACLSSFYASDHLWGIIMDDDAILYDSPVHNSGASFFSEMAANALADYADVDIFFPINSGKPPGHNEIWKTAPLLYRDHHVFCANYDLKGSLLVVRNFRLSGRKEILAPPFSLLGEDTLLAAAAVSEGCTVFRCDNIVLKEFQGPSHFTHSKRNMKLGNQAIASMYAAQGLRMGAQHLLNRRDFIKRCISNRPKRVVVKKP